MEGGIRGSYHSIGSRKLYFNYSRTTKPSVIFISGMGDSSDTWEKIQILVSQEASTLSYDRSGVGRSEAAPPVPRTCLDLVEELSELLLAGFVDPPFILVGHSFGGLVARLFASVHPQLVCGLVLVDAAPEYKELAYARVLPPQLRAANRDYYENPRLNIENIDKARSYEQVSVHSGQSDIPLAILTRGLPERSDGDWPVQELLKIEQRLQADFQRLSNASKLRIAGRSRHYIHVDEPELVVEEIESMIKGIKR